MMSLRWRALAAVSLGLLALTARVRAAIDGSAFLGRWQEINHPENTLEVTPSGKYFVFDAPVLEQRLKLNAVFNDGALQVSGPAGNILATYDSVRDRLIFLKEYQRVTVAGPAPTPVPPNPDAIAAAFAALPPAEAGDPKRNDLRRLATAILNDLRVIEGAMTQCAIETNLPGSAIVRPMMLHAYFKRGSRLHAQAMSGAATFTDLLGNPIRLLTIDAGPSLSDRTRDGFSEVIADPKAFWGEYLQP